MLDSWIEILNPSPNQQILSKLKDEWCYDGQRILLTIPRNLNTWFFWLKDEPSGRNKKLRNNNIETNKLKKNYICFLKNNFLNLSVFVCYYTSYSTEKTFQSKKNLVWFLKKFFLEKFRRKILFGRCEKFKNIILFTNYNKFGFQAFNFYVFCFVFFLILPLKIWFL